MKERYKPNLSILRFLAKGAGRVILAAVMIFIGFAAILWDQGYFSLPFIGKGSGIPQRKDPEAKETKEEIIFDYDAYARDIVLSFMRSAEINDAAKLICTDKYDTAENTLIISELGSGDYSVNNGFISKLSGDNIEFYYPLTPDTIKKGYFPTLYSDEKGNKIFTASEKYYIYSDDISDMVEISFAPPENTAEPEKTPAFPEGFEYVSYSEGIYLIKNDKYFTYYSEKGIMLTDPVYTTAYPFSEGIAVVTDENGKFGMIDSSGNEIVGTAFDSITSFSGGISILKKGTENYLLCKIKGTFGDMPKPPKTSSKIYYTKAPLIRGETVSTTRTVVIIISENDDTPMWPEIPLTTEAPPTS